MPPENRLLSPPDANPGPLAALLAQVGEPPTPKVSRKPIDNPPKAH